MNAIRLNGKIQGGAAASMQWRTGLRNVSGVRISVPNPTQVGLSLKVKTTEHWWVGLLAMTIPLASLLLESLGLQ